MKTILVLFVSLELAFAANICCPRIVSRQEWGARPPLTRTPLEVSPVPWAVVHHSASSGCLNLTSCSALVRSFQNLHMDTNHWDDIGYSFLVGEDGNVYEGRGWDLTGAHAPGYNSKSVGLCVIGTFISRLPDPKALDALERLVDCGVSLGKVRPDYSLIGHRQARPTECPGTRLYQLIQASSHWTDV